MRSAGSRTWRPRRCVACSPHSTCRPAPMPKSPRPMRICVSRGARPSRRSSPPKPASRSRCGSSRTVSRSCWRTAPAATGTAEARDGRALLPAIDQPGYHHLVIGDQEATLAVAPAACFSLADVAPGRKLWGLSAQLYGLRREGDGGIGDFAALRDLVRAAAARGAAAVAVSPVHAQFSADCDRFSPYSPSSRVMLNVLHADAGDASDAAARGAGAGAADRLAGRRARQARPPAPRLRLPPDRAALDRFRAEHGDALEQHARFEALHGHIWGNDPARWHWRTWPDAYRDPDSPAVADFARAHADEVAFHAFLQMRAEQGLAAAQATARAAGMPIGLIADLAVGADDGGSHCWSRQEETLLGLVAGAPPDLLSREGQNWGLSRVLPARPARPRVPGVPRDAAREPAPRRRRADRSRDGPDAAVADPQGRGGGGRRLSALPVRRPAPARGTGEPSPPRDRARRGPRHRARGLPRAAARRAHHGNARAVVRAREGREFPRPFPLDPRCGGDDQHPRSADRRRLVGGPRPRMAHRASA